MDELVKWKQSQNQLRGPEDSVLKAPAGTHAGGEEVREGRPLIKHSENCNQSRDTLKSLGKTEKNQHCVIHDDSMYQMLLIKDAKLG